MAIVTRRFVHVGPLTTDLQRYVSPTASAVAAFPRAILDVQYDNAVAGVTETLDEFMASLGFMVTAAVSPRQTFTYVAIGGEANPFVVGNAQGFVTRLTANYVVSVTLTKPLSNAFKMVAPVAGSLQVNQFQLELSAALEAGDILSFDVEDVT